MPIITFVGSTGGNAINGGNVTLTYRGQYSSNAYALVAVTLATSKASVLAVASSSGAAFTQVVTTIASSYARFGVFRRLLGSSAETQCTITGTGGSTDATSCVIHLFRNVDITTPEDATATSTTGASSTPDSPSITVASCGCAIISAIGISILASPTAPSSFLNLTMASGNDTRDATTSQAWITNLTTGAFNPAAWGSTLSNQWCSATIALRPAAFIWDEVGITSAEAAVKEARLTIIRSY